MKHPSILAAAFLILLCSAVICIAQDKPKAIQIDEFGKITCEDFLARADNLAYRLAKDPTASGIAVIHWNRPRRYYASFFGKILTGAVFMRGSAKNHLTVIFDEDAKDMKGEFWMVPFGATAPTFPGKIIGKTPPDLSEPFLAGTDAGDNICSTFSPDGIAAILRENPKLRLHIIIYNMSARDRVESALYWRNTFVKEHNISPKRLRITFARKGKFPFSNFWLLPPKKP